MTGSIDQALLNAALRQDLGTFIAKVFKTVSPGDVYLHNWHIDAIVYQLMQVHAGENRRLIVTQPPRSLKSICTSVAFVAWCLGHDPSLRFACVSYSHELGATFARQFRAVGADIIIIDDPMKADEAQSEKARQATNDWYATALLSRLDDKEKGAIILVMQRLHEDDLAGKLLREGGWHHLDLPAIAEEDQEVAIGPDAPYRRKKNDVLHPAREPRAVLEAIKREMGSLTFSAQYQQRPIPLEGNLVKRNWIKWYENAPSRDSGAQVVQSWDVASTPGSTNDWSVCTTWLVMKRNYYLLNGWRGRLEFPQLKRKLIDLAIEHKPNTILIEQAGPGLHLIQEFRANPAPGVPLPIGIKPEGDKRDRMAAQSARFEAGQVHMPKEAPWLGDFLHEVLGFPNSRHDDQIDSVSQFLNWAESHCKPMSFAAPIIFTRPRVSFDMPPYW